MLASCDPVGLPIDHRDEIDFVMGGEEHKIDDRRSCRGKSGHVITWLEQALFIGDSATDVEAGRAASVPTIGYANKPGKDQRLRTAGAAAVVASMSALADALQQAPAEPQR